MIIYFIWDSDIVDIRFRLFLNIIQTSQFKRRIIMSFAHHKVHVNYTMDEPIQLLMEKLSSKSSDLYIFWQNYNQMYIQFNQKVHQNLQLRQQIDILKREKSRTFTSQESEFRQRIRIFEKQNQELRHEIDKQRSQNNQIKRQNHRVIQQSTELRTLISQLREQNNLQKVSIEKILTQLKQAQNQINNYAKIYQQVAYKQSVINNFIERETQFQQCIGERQDEIQLLMREIREMKLKYQQVFHESMQSAKSKVIQALPVLLRNSRRKVKIVTEGHN